MPGSRPRNMKSAPALAIVLSALLAMLLLGILAQYLPSSRERVHDAIAPDVAALLPPGAVERARAELPDTPQNAHVVVYALGSDETLALIAWDKEQGRYALAGETTYEEGDERPLETTSLTVESLGLGAPVAVLARGPLGASTELVAVFARSGGTIAPVLLTGEDGRTIQAQFVAGASVTHADDVRFEDVDGDGDKDAVAISSESPEGIVVKETRTVYAWRNGQFVHDPELSRLTSMRSALFPEPDAAPAVEEETVGQE